jgi:hypothetical protein
MAFPSARSVEVAVLRRMPPAIAPPRAACSTRRQRREVIWLAT